MYDQLLSIKQIKSITGLSRTTIWRLEKEGNFPKRRRASKHLVRWLKSEVQHWVESRDVV